MRLRAHQTAWPRPSGDICRTYATCPGFSFAWFVDRWAAFGEPYFDENMNPQVNSPNAVIALQNMVDSLQNAPPDVLGYGYQELRDASQSEVVFIAGGVARLGTDENAESRAYPERSVDLPAFDIDAHPVTFEQYGNCVEAGICEPPSLPADQPDFDDPEPEWPVVFVDAFQAAAYCDWQGRRLPSEAEFERAARGTEGRVWPWGDSPTPAPDRVHAILEGFHDANTLPPFTPTTVNSLPAGATSEEPEDGIAHLLGNVWEWTRTPYRACKNDPYGCQDLWDGKQPVDKLFLRGLSYQEKIFPDHLDTITRALDLPPYATFADVGFRCANAQ